MYGSVAAVALPLVKFFKHSGPLPNPTRTDNHDNSDNVAQRRPQPALVGAHPPPIRPTHSPRLPTARSAVTHQHRRRRHALRQAPRHLRSAAALRVARRGEGLEGEELLRHECGRPVERLVDAMTPSQAALEVGLPAQRCPWW